MPESYGTACLINLPIPPITASVKPKIQAAPLKQQRGIGKIVGGTDAKDGEFPFQVRCCQAFLLTPTSLLTS